MKSLQDGKLVFLCVQNASTKSNTEALQGVRDFKAEAQYTGVTEIVMLDPAIGGGVLPGRSENRPPDEGGGDRNSRTAGCRDRGVRGRDREGSVVAALQKASSACGPGGSCGPGGCGPR